MARVNDLTGSRVQERKRQVRTYGTKTDLSSTTVDRGDTHWMNSSRVSIDGVLDVTGLTTISGTLNVSGTTTLSGSTTIAGPTGITGALTIAGSMDVTGPSTFAGTLGINGATTITGLLDVTGPTTLAGTLDITGDTTVTGALGIDGDTTITGKLDIEGDTTVSGDFEIAAGGKFRSGTVEISPDGSAKFGPTTISKEGVVKTGQMELRPDSGGQLAFSGGALTKDSFGLLLNTNGPMGLLGTSIDLTGTTNVNGALWLKALPETDLAPNLHITSQGQVFRTRWTPS